MSRLLGTGPEEKGQKTGRSLGTCLKNEDHNVAGKLGTGLAQRRKSGGGKGKGKRLKSGLKEMESSKNDHK